MPGALRGRVSRAATARATGLATTAALGAACAFDIGFSPRLGPGLVPYLTAVGDVADGRTPLVDTASRGGWGAIDALGAIFATAPLGYGTLVLAVSGAAAICALCVLVVATSALRPLRAALPVAAAAIAIGALGGPVPDTAAPSAGALTLLVPMLAAVVVVLGADRPRWRPLAPVCCLLGVMWSAPAAALTILAVAAGIRGWPAGARGRNAGWCAVACLGGVLTYALATLARAGTLPDPDLLLATHPLAASPGEPALTATNTVLGAVVLGAVVVAWWAWWRRDPNAGAPASGAAVGAIGALAATLAAHGLAVGAPVEIAHAAGLTLLLAGIVALTAYGRAGVGAFAVVLLAVGASTASTIGDRWRTSALYAAVPHQPVEALGLGGDRFDQSLRYNIGVLSRRPLILPDVVLQASSLIGETTRRGERVLVLLPGAQHAEVLAVLDRTGLLPIGDPTTSDVVGELRSRLRDAIRALPDHARLLTRQAWLEGPADTGAPFGEQPAARQALRLLLEDFEARVIARRDSDLALADLRRRPPASRDAPGSGTLPP